MNIKKFEAKFKRLMSKPKHSYDDYIKITQMKKAYIERFRGLEMSDQVRVMIIENPLQCMEYTNGVGSDVGIVNSLLKWLIPSWVRNKMFGVDITPASDLHDIEYSVSIEFKTLLDGVVFKDHADRYFSENLQTLIKQDKKLDKLDNLRFLKSRLYFLGVGMFGYNSFWSGKVKPKV